MVENTPEHTGFFQNALAIRGSVSPRVMPYVLLTLAYASIISTLNLFFPDWTLPIAPFEYWGVVMGLILVFRVNAGYDRWWEARKVWGNVVNHSRNLALIVSRYSVCKENKAWAETLRACIIVFPWLMKDHLRNDYQFEPLEVYLDKASVEKLRRSPHPMIALSDLMSQKLNEGRQCGELDDFAFLRAESTRALLVDALGMCERILKTPMPFVMAVKARRFILIFLLMLPFALIHVSSVVVSPVVSGLVAYALLALDQIGVELQNPFSKENLSHLPLTKICETITKDVMQISLS